MAYSNFTLGTVRRAFQLEAVEERGIFAYIEPVAPSEHLTSVWSEISPSPSLSAPKRRSPK